MYGGLRAGGRADGRVNMYGGNQRGRNNQHNAHRDNRPKYLSPHSDRQIMEIVQRGTPYDLGALVSTISKHISDKRQREDIIKRALFSRLSDSQVYKLLSDQMPPTAGPDSGVGASAGYNRGKVFASSYFDVLKENAKIAEKPAYLDMGCGDGSITREFAKMIDAKSIDCVDVKDYSKKEDGEDANGASADGDSAETKLKYTVVPEDTTEYKLPFEDNSFDVITAFQVLHHVKNVESMISEIYRVCKIGGVVMIKEHNAHTPFQAMTIDVEHIIYMVHDKEFDPDAYYIKLFTRDSLDKAMSKFKKSASDYYYTNKLEIQRPDMSFWAIYEKPNV